MNEQFLTYRPLPGARLNMAHPLTKGLVGMWLLNEGGYRAMDLSPYGNHGVLTNFASPARRPFNGLPFDGTDDHINCGNKSILNIPTGGITLEVFLKLTVALGTFQSFLSKGTIASGLGYAIQKVTTNVVRFLHTDAGAGTVLDTVATLARYVDYHIVVTMDVANLAKIYIDASELASGVLNARVSNTQDLIIGARDAGVTQNWGGTIGLVRIWKDNALSKDNVKWLHAEPYCMFL